MTVKQTARFALLVLAGAIALAGVAVVTTAATTPGCTACHARVDSTVADTAAGAHASVKCAACHVPKDLAGRVSFASREIFGMALRLGAADDRAAAAVPDSACLTCHAGIYDSLTESKGYRIDHVNCASNAACTSCHSTTAHGTDGTWPRTSEMGTCLGCHSTREASENCDVCHDPRTPSERLSRGTAWAVTHGAQWKTTHGMGDLKTCSACHKPEYCSDCHGIALPHPDRYVTTRHAAEARSNRAACDGCHRREFCDSCHGGVEMPHPKTFIKGHVTYVKDKTDASCKRCHAESDCTTCHVKHVHPVMLEQAARGATK